MATIAKVKVANRETTFEVFIGEDRNMVEKINQFDDQIDAYEYAAEVYNGTGMPVSVYKGNKRILLYCDIDYWNEFRK